ncbi:MerR family transcriptional regulator [Micromonospora andamanensis]|uniref:MerR family transcriptional regulator n=1 Tax=Micromonospora andamanensis TaxID=1287068 RepID=UPI00194F5950|nr:MerR family transcriptional regulator [Micromonospora andamanensis]
MTVLTGPPRTFSVSEVAVDSGVAPSAVRFYDTHGVINAVRTAGNQRRFDSSAACRIQVAKLAQRAGLSVREIAALFADLSADPTPDEWADVARRLVTEVEERVRDLKAQLAAMESGTRLCEIGRDDPAR